MFARSFNLQKEYMLGLYAGEIGLLVVALLIIIRTLFAAAPDTPTTIHLQSTQANADVTLVSRAKERIQNQDLAGGIALLDAAIEIAAEPQADWFATRAGLYNRLKSYEKAITDFQQALLRNPNNAYYHTGLCYSAAQVHDYATAVTHCDDAIKLTPQDWVVWNDRCYLRAYHTGNYASAITDCNQALAMNGSHAYPYNNRARAYLMAGNYTEAIADATRSLDLHNPYPALPYTTRATAYLAMGNAYQALLDYQAALAADSAYPELHLRLGELYRMQGQRQNALNSYCTYLELETHPIQYVIDQTTVLGGCS